VSVATILAAAPALAQTTTPSASPPGAASSPSPSSARNLSRNDQSFVRTAAEDGMAEVDLGKLGQQKAQNPQVKQLADTIVKDHQAANGQLMSIASSKGLEVSPTRPQSEARTRDKLAKLSGGDFDRQYADQLAKDHRKDISAFQKEATSGQDPDVKNFAAQTLPTLQEHLRLAEVAAKATKSASRGPSTQSGAAKSGSSVPRSGATAPQ
jgi:putative membrane protein